MRDWQSGEIKANGIRLHYTRTGPGAEGRKPTLVLAHGFSDDGLCWTPVVAALESDYDIVMFDARGHGRSEDPEHGYGSAEHADDLASAIAALELQRPTILGHSMGAATALRLAGAYPDVPRAILLEDPPALWMRREGQPVTGDRPSRMNGWIVELKRKTRDEMIAAQRAQTPDWSEAELEPWADAKLRLSFNVLNRGDAASVDWPATMRSITCPALLITAEPSRGAIVDEQSAAALQTLVPHLRVTHIPAAGHSIRRDQFGLYIEAVRSFLNEYAPTADPDGV